VLHVEAADLLASVTRRLKDEFGFDLFLDVTAVDWPERQPRFDVVYHFYSTRDFVRVRLKTRVPESDPTVATSLVALYGSAAFMERECHDMYGIHFRGNPDLRPILLYEGFVGHPLRKDYPKTQEQPLVAYREGGPPAEAGLARAAEPESGRPSPKTLHARLDGVIINIGPSHPATHGTMQIIAESPASGWCGPMCTAATCTAASRRSARRTYLAQPDPLHRPAELLLRADQQLRLLRGGREADGHRDDAAHGTCARCCPSTRGSPTT
jgi:NADH-quinone oxidoreductase subunit C